MAKNKEKKKAIGAPCGSRWCEVCNPHAIPPERSEKDKDDSDDEKSSES